ncbi:MAG: hypothetical protein AB7U41_03610 [Dongiaceae bacterium]
MSGPVKQNSKIKLRHFGLLALVLLVGLSGCTAPRQMIEPEFTKEAPKAKIPDPIIGEDTNQAIVNINIPPETLVPTALEVSDPLPDRYVDNFSALDATANEAFRLLLMDTNIALATDKGADEVKINITNYNGNLSDIMDRMSETAGVFWNYRQGLVRLTKDRSFVVPLPPIADALEDMSAMIAAIGGSDVKLDKTSRMVTYKATRRSADAIASYLERVRKQKVMIVYETYIFEVLLNDASQLGVNWSQIPRRVPAITSSTLASTFNTDSSNNQFLDITAIDASGTLSGIETAGLSFGSVFRSGSLNISVLLKFLKTQGNVETISKPVITLLSGGKSKFEVGRKERFVSRRGVATLTSSGTGEGTQTTLETEDLNTGLKMEISGDYSDGAVFTTINLSLDDLIQFAEVTASVAGTGSDATPLTINLPKTSTRLLNTSVQARPGDAIILAGINQSRDERSISGPFESNGFFPILRENTKVARRSELVIVLKPRLVNFAHSTPAKAGPAMARKTSGRLDSMPLVPPKEGSVMKQPAMTASPENKGGDPYTDSQMLFMPEGGNTSSAPMESPQSMNVAPMNSAPAMGAAERDITAGDIYRPRGSAITAPRASTMTPKKMAPMSGDPLTRPLVPPSSATSRSSGPTMAPSAEDPLVDSVEMFGRRR